VKKNDEPTFTTGEPNENTGEPTSVTGELTSVTGELASVTGKPTSFTGEPIHQQCLFTTDGKGQSFVSILHLRGLDHIPHMDKRYA